MTRPPRITVMMAVHDVAPFLPAALDSVLRQSCGDFEIVAVDDGSRDGSGAILRANRDPRLRVLHQANRGIAPTRNRILGEARGEYVAVFDADDEMLPDRLERQLAYLDAHPDCVIVGGQLIEMTEEGEELSAAQRFAVDPAAVQRELQRQDAAVIPHPGCMYRRAAAQAAGGYAPGLRMIGEDLDLIRRLLRRGAGANLPVPVTRYRLRRGSACTVHRRDAAASRRRARQGEAGPEVREAPTLARHRAEAVYYCRIGRAALRGARYDRALAYYARSLAAWPFQALAYTGLVRAWLRAGAAPGLPRHGPAS